MGRLLRLSAKVNINLAKPDEAMVDCAGIIRIGDAAEARNVAFCGSLTGVSKLICLLVGIAERGFARKELATVLDTGEPSAEALKQYLAALGDVDSRARFQKTLRGERCFGIAQFEDSLQDPAAPNPPMWHSQAIAYLEALSRCIEMAGKPLVQSKEDWKKLEDTTPKDSLAGNRVPGLVRTALNYDRGVAIDGVSQLRGVLTKS